MLRRVLLVLLNWVSMSKVTSVMFEHVGVANDTWANRRVAAARKQTGYEDSRNFMMAVCIWRLFIVE